MTRAQFSLNILSNALHIYIHHRRLLVDVDPKTTDYIGAGSLRLLVPVPEPDPDLEGE